jgi:hypothetical protein
MELKEKLSYKTHWTIKRYADEKAFEADNSFNTSEVEGNLLLNEGITELLTLLTGGTATAFSNANAYIGVGDSNTAASASQTGLQASTNKAYVGMEANYPSVSNQTVTARSVFGSGVGNFSWQEMTFANGNSDSSKNLNRKVSDQGTKVSGQIWTIDLAITIS